MNGWTDKWMEGGKELGTNECMDEQTDGGRDIWMDR